MAIRDTKRAAGVKRKRREQHVDRRIFKFSLGWNRRMHRRAMQWSIGWKVSVSTVDETQ